MKLIRIIVDILISSDPLIFSLSHGPNAFRSPRGPICQPTELANGGRRKCKSVNLCTELENDVDWKHP